MNATDFAAFIDKQIERNPIEAKILRKIIRSCKAAGTPVTYVYDGDVYTPVRTEREIFEQVFNLDEAYLFTNDNVWIRFVLGNDWYCVVDYITSLEAAMEPVNDYIEKYGE